MAKKPLPEASEFVAYLHSLFDYNPEDGLLRWKVDRNSFAGRAKAGEPAGWPDRNGYIYIRVNGRALPAHRLAWLMMTGAWNDHEIDHINQVKNDNRWCNLRIATRSQNNMNRPHQVNNRLGIRGVSFHGVSGKFMARINHTYLGLFNTVEEARVAYLAAARSQHGDFVPAE